MFWSNRKIQCGLIFFGVCLCVTVAVVMHKLHRHFYTSLRIGDALGYYASQNEGVLPASWDEFVKAGYGKWSEEDSDTLLARYHKGPADLCEIYLVSAFKIRFGLKARDFTIKDSKVYDAGGNKIHLISLAEFCAGSSCSDASLELAWVMKEAEAKKEDGAAKDKAEGIDQNQVKRLSYAGILYFFAHKHL